MSSCGGLGFIMTWCLSRTCPTCIVAKQLVSALCRSKEEALLAHATYLCIRWAEQSSNPAGTVTYRSNLGF